MKELEKLPIILSKDKFGLDYLWERLPHISFYQLRITGMASYASVLGGFLAIYPVFAQYTPPYRCKTVFDNNEEFSWLTWKQMETLTNETPFCRLKNLILLAKINPAFRGFDGSELSSGASCGHCVYDSASIESCDHDQDFSALQNCLGQSAQEIANWTDCNDNFSFDRSLNNRTNLLFNAGQPWETAVTQFKLICGEEWFDSLSTALGLLSLMIGPISLEFTSTDTAANRR